MNTASSMMCLALDINQHTLLLPIKMVAEIVRIPADWVDWQVGSSGACLGQVSWQTEIIAGLRFDQELKQQQDRYLFAILQFAPFCEGVPFLALKLMRRPKTLWVAPEQYRYLEAARSVEEWCWSVNPPPFMVPNFSVWAQHLQQFAH